MTIKTFPGTNEMRRIMGWEDASSTAIELLRRLDETGSINSAAKVMGLSYKSAWQKLDQLNNIVPYPLITKQAGGAAGEGLC